MPGGLMQLVGVGAQNQLTTGNPTFTFFKAMYRKHTNFAMEHFTLTFRGTDLNLPTENQKTLRCKFDRNSDMLHDTYLLVNLPNIWSPIHILPGVPPTALGGNARPFLFQWIDNIGYNLIESVSLLINGSKIVTFTGEWLKFYSYLTHDKNKKEIVDQMVGNIPELYDPANSGGRTNNYPNAIQGTDPNLLPQPSILGRQLVIPLHFWFCEQVGKALPLIALQYSEVEVSVTFRNIYQLYTIMDVDPTSQTYGQRIAPNAGNPLQNISNFLSPPLIDGTPTNPDLVNWAANPLIEANYIFLSEPERREVAASDHGFMIPEVRLTSGEGLVGDTVSPLNMFNLCTRVVFAYQRSDRLLANDWDNYTNWEDPALQPLLLAGGGSTATVLNSSGVQLPDSVTDRNILLQAYLEFDGKERFKEKPRSFFDLIQHYRHHTGSTSKLPGLYAYSFSLDHATTQPSGSANGSMFNKTNLRSKLQVPANLVPNIGACGVPTTVEKTEVCVFKDTVFNSNPTPAPVTTEQDKVLAIYRINSTGQNYPYPYTYSGRFYVESYNYLRIMSGTANVAFSS